MYTRLQASRAFSYRTAQALDGVSCVSATQCWVVGANGVILGTVNGGTTWTSETSGTTQLLAAVSCVSTTAEPLDISNNTYSSFAFTFYHPNLT